MNILDKVFKKQVAPSVTLKAGPTTPGGDVVERTNEGVMKSPAYYEFLYKPPFGYPRGVNAPLLKAIARNGYIFSVISKLQEEAAWATWRIVPADQDQDWTPELEAKRDEIMNFINNPNGNKEGWSFIVKQTVRDICEIDAGVWVKVFNRGGKLCQLFARDGATFLKNPDTFGYMGNREDIIFPDKSMDGVLYNTPPGMDSNTAMVFNNRYSAMYAGKAAYFQYGWQASSLPIPFGKREIVYFSKNPRADSIYGISPVETFADIIMTLVYGSNYNLDFYMNSNTPEGIIQILGAQKEEIENFKQRMTSIITTKDPVTGFPRKVSYKLPVTSGQAAFIPFQIPSRELQVLEQQGWFTKLVWAGYGISADDMGFTEDSNRAVSQEQGKKFARKAVKPILNMIAERINMEIIPEFGTTELKFEYDDYDLGEDIQKHALYEAQIRMGIKTPEMVAEEERIDIKKLKQQKDEASQKEVDKEIDIQSASQKDTKFKAEQAESELEADLVKQVDEHAKLVMEQLEKHKDGALTRIA